MEFDNLFESRNADRGRKKYNYSGYQDHENEYRGNDREERPDISFYASQFLNRIRTNRKLKLLLIIASIIVLGILVLIIFAIFPLIVKIFNYLTQNGINGIIEGITGIVDKILNGVGK
jgi:hypothetical protein